jgi:hypothetical protein
VPRGCGNEIPTLGRRQRCHQHAEQIGDRAAGAMSKDNLSGIDKRISTCMTRRSSQGSRWWTGRGRQLGAEQVRVRAGTSVLDVESGDALEG